MVAVAVIGAATIGAVATSSAANSASKAETNAANQANATESAQYQQTRNDLMPYQTAGQSDLTQYNNLIGTGSGGSGAMQSTLAQTPGYQFTLSQGLKAAQNSAAARGLGVSGAAYKGATNYAGGLADQTYQNQVGNALTGAQLGENAAAQTGSYGVQIANQIGNNTTSAGNAQAASSIAGGNAIGALASSVPNALIYNSLLGGGGSMYASMPAPLQYTPYGG